MNEKVQPHVNQQQQFLRKATDTQMLHAKSAKLSSTLLLASIAVVSACIHYYFLNKRQMNCNRFQIYQYSLLYCSWPEGIILLIQLAKMGLSITIGHCKYAFLFFLTDVENGFTKRYLLKGVGGNLLF